MKTNIVAPIGGILILAGGIALSVYTATNAPVLQASKDKLVKKYVALSEKALSSGNLSEAEKFAKRAIAANPTSKEALAEYKKIVLSSCPKVTTPAPTAPTTTTEKKATTPTTPAKPEAESEEEMGCI